MNENKMFTKFGKRLKENAKLKNARKRRCKS